jgi:hypothetical protein
MSTAMPRVFSLPPDLRQRAWKALVKELGIVDATRFVMAVEPGEGDSVEKYAQRVFNKVQSVLVGESSDGS